MAKIGLLVLGLVLVYWLLRHYRRRIDRSGAPPAVQTEDMVRCDHCGVHLPRSESVVARDHHFCTREHQRQHEGG